MRLRILSKAIAGILLAFASVTLETGKAMAADPSDFPWRSISPPTAIVPLWEKTIPGNEPPAPAAGFILSDLLQTTDGSRTLLGKVDGKPSLFIDPTTSGPGKIVSLPTDADGLRIAKDNAGGFWVGGFKNERYQGIESHHLSEAYLAKVDRDGRVVWEQSFGTNTRRTIESLASLPSGEVIVSGSDHLTNWLAKISPEGRIEWERFIGLARRTSVSVIHDTIFLAGLDGGNGDRDDYHEDVVLWSLDIADGNVLDRRIVRSRITTTHGLFLGTIKVLHSANAIFVFSSGYDSSDVPIEVAKLGFDGDTLWRATLEQSVQKQSIGSPRSCWAPGVTLLENGDPLIACAIREQVILFRIGLLAGDVRRTTLLLPACHHNFAAALFLALASPSYVWIFGSRPQNVYDESCTWLGVVPRPN